MGLDEVSSPKNLIIAFGGFFFTQRLRAEANLVLVAQCFRSIFFHRCCTSYEYLASKWVVGLAAQTVDVIEQDARNHLKERFHWDADVLVKVYEVWWSWSPARQTFDF